MMLADAAQAVGGKLYILGGGWSVIPTGLASAIGLYLQVPWDQASVPHTLRLELLDLDGHPVLNEEAVPISIEAQFETGRPAGVKPGTPLDFTMAVNVPALPLEPENRYEWRLSIDGHADDAWRLPFSTRSPVAPPMPPGMPPG